MPSYTLAKGRMVVDGRIAEVGDKVTLDAKTAEPLIERGMLEAPRSKGRAQSSDDDAGQPGGRRRRGWTPGDDDTDNDTEGGEG
jgi:hypothetical protein